MGKQISARERFRKVFEHNTSELDRLPMLSLGTPSQGLFYQNWIKLVENDEVEDDFVRLTHFGDKTISKWINSEWHNTSIGYPVGYPSVPLPPDHPEWGNFKNEKDISLSISWTGTINASGKKMHGESYGWYVDGFFNRQKTAEGKVLAPYEVRDQFYAQYGYPWDDQFAPSESSKKHFQSELQWYEANYNNFDESGFSDFALMCSAGSLFENTWEGMGSGTPAMAMMCRKYPGQLQSWLHDVKEVIMKNIKLQYELAEEVDAQIDFIWLWDDTGQKGRPLIDPKYHKQFWVPLYKEISDYVHAHNGFLIVHSCGFCESIVPNWIEGGVDAWQTIERAALVEPARIREQYGNKITLIGAVDATNVVSFAESALEIRDHVKQTMIDAVYSPDDACYIPGFTHDLLDCPVQNVRTAVDAMLEFGQIDSLRNLKK